MSNLKIKGFDAFMNCVVLIIGDKIIYNLHKIDLNVKSLGCICLNFWFKCLFAKGFEIVGYIIKYFGCILIHFAILNKTI